MTVNLFVTLYTYVVTPAEKTSQNKPMVDPHEHPIQRTAHHLRSFLFNNSVTIQIFITLLYNHWLTARLISGRQVAVPGGTQRDIAEGASCRRNGQTWLLELVSPRPRYEEDLNSPIWP